jgi:hypothetical protein
LSRTRVSPRNFAVDAECPVNGVNWPKEWQVWFLMAENALWDLFLSVSEEQEGRWVRRSR